MVLTRNVSHGLRQLNTCPQVVVAALLEDMLLLGTGFKVKSLLSFQFALPIQVSRRELSASCSHGHGGCYASLPSWAVTPSETISSNEFLCL